MGSFMQNHMIGFIGAGSMATSLIGGLIADGFPANKIWASEPMADKLASLKQKFNINCTLSNQEVASNADVLVFAVKPQILKKVAAEAASVVAAKHSLIISIAAGVREPDLRRWLGEKTAIVRCMPNTPALIQSGATGLYANSHVSQSQKNLAESILRAVGLTVWVNNEEQLDIVTALSGSGPAYFFLIMEALEQAAVDAGLPREASRLLTLQTALGAARMALESSDSVAELRQRVTSPGGTTESALQVLVEGETSSLFANAVNAAVKRAQVLGKMFGE